ncbi:hypothetical protein [Methylobacterium nodulans]|uniref:Uncharacterized protein n=1 Tax=Methylobacterium nodulans (strain LMG 21967 / CNCM I-2342 / ORS 2060) TaxID=460265 RepID=B8IXV7_METNO|nr:hypothetical protein [Methylobacterium nodulans]ACL63247.1 hypothetical protein Mnod_8786 [Methylobacterium nodulans ORS 2060]
MPAKRRTAKSRMHRITSEAVEAFEAGDYHRLHAALGLRPWEASPLPWEVHGLGVSDGPRPPWTNAFTESWEQAQELQRALLEAGAKMPTKDRPCR